MKKNNVEKMISPGLKIETELKYEEILQDKLDSIEDLFNLNTRRLDEVSFKRNELNKQEEELSAKKGDTVIAFDDEAPVDTVLGVDIFPVVHEKTQEKIYVSLEDIEEMND